MNRIQQAQSSMPVRQRPSCRPLTRLPLALTLALLSTVLAACQARQAEQTSTTEVRSDGRFHWTLTRLGNATATNQIEWLDNNTILFIGVDKAKRSGLFAWDLQGKARLILPDAYRLCFDGKTWRALVTRQDPINQKKSYTRYKINPSDLSTRRIGPMASPPGGGYSDSYTCDEEPFPLELEGRPWTELRPIDGKLELGIGWKPNQEAFLLDPRSQRRVPLGLRVTSASTTVADYSNYGKSYLLYNLNITPTALEAWNKSGKYIIHTLTAPNHVRRIEISRGPWSEVRGGDREFEMARHGIIISSKAGAPTKINSSGIYIARENSAFTKLDDGIVESPTVSPDGCNLTYKRSWQDNSRSLTHINICSSDEK